MEVDEALNHIQYELVFGLADSPTKLFGFDVVHFNMYPLVN